MKHRRCYFLETAENEEAHSVDNGDPEDIPEALVQQLDTAISVDGSVTAGPAFQSGTAISVQESVTAHCSDASGSSDASRGLSLDRFNLCYRQEYKLLICLCCKVVLRRGFANHMKRVHQVRISPGDESSIMQSCFTNVSPYLEAGHPLLPAIDFLETFDGYMCGHCYHYGKSRRHMKEHMNEMHDSQDEPTPCKVQTVSTSCIKTYFGILPVTVGAQTAAPAGASEIQ